MEYMDNTVLNTPQPQATSTIEKKNRNTQKEIKKTNLNYTPIEENSRASSRTSMQSSLGILSFDNLESFSNLSLDYKDSHKENKDLKDSRIKMPHPTNSLTEKYLTQQRALAMKTIERADALQKSKEVNGLPSYLLKADSFGQSLTNSVAVKDDSTVNASDLDHLANEKDKLSFSLKEITGRSSSFSNEIQQTIDLKSQKKQFDTSCDSEYNVKCRAIFDKIRKSDIQFHQMYNKPRKSDFETINISDSSMSSWNPETQDSLFLKLENELFTPAENAINKLEADEIEWHKNQDTIPEKSDTSQANLSTFSGYIDNNTSSISEKFSITDFFRQKSEKLSAFDFKSPDKKHRPIPLIDLTNSIAELELPRSDLPIETEEPKNFNTNLSESTVLSVSRIEKAIEEMGPQFTPKKVMNYLLNPKSYKNKNVISETNKTSVNMQKNQNTLSSTKISPQRSILSEINNKNYNTKSEILTPKTSEHVCNTESDINNRNYNKENIKKHNRKSGVISTKLSENSSNFNEVKIKNDVIVIDDSSDNIDATLSSIKESPSISCSELQFSDDADTSIEYVNNSFTDWIQVEQSFESYKTCVLVESDIWIDVLMQTDKWILYTVELAAVKLENQLIKNTDDVILTRLPNENELFKRDNKQMILIQYLTFVIGHIELTLNIKMKDMVTKMEKEHKHTLYIDSEKIDLQIKEKLLNFDTLPEDSKKIENISIYNNTKIDFYVNLAIVQENNIFSIGNNDNDKNLNAEKNSTKILLRNSENTLVPISMFAPSLSTLKTTSHVKEFMGKLVVYLQNKITKIFSEIDLIGRIGFTKIQFRSMCLPLILNPNQAKILNVKNSGVVTMDLKAIIIDGKIKIEDNNFTIVPNSISLKPSQSGELSIMYNSSEKITEPLYRVLRVFYENGPSFTCEIEVTDMRLSIPGRSPIHGTKSPRDIKTSPRSFSSPILSPQPPDIVKIRSPIVSRNGRNSPRAIGKIRSPVSSLSCRNSSRDILKTLSPSQSSASTDTGSMCYPYGKLPIEASRRELVWDCVKQGKSQTQEFIIRNRSSQKVRFNINIDGTAFKIIKETEQLSSLRITLHERESRKLIVNFTPIVIGAVSAKIIFSPVETCAATNPKPQMVILYGYGGHVNIDINDVFKDLSGKIWLPFGKKLNHNNVLERTINLKNTGTLTAFYQFNLCPRSFLSNSLRISPKEGILTPGKEIDVLIRFTPKREDLNLLRSSRTSDVFEVALLKLVAGAEATRGRLRKIQSRMSNEGLTCFSTDLLTKLTVAFPDECMPADLAICREQDTSNSIKELFRGLTTREIILTMEEDADLTMTLSQMDDSYMFQTLCHETQLSVMDETLLDKSNRRTSTGFCTVEPTKIILTPPPKTTDIILLKSQHSRPMPFEIRTTLSELSVEPKIGVVPPGETIVLSVSWNPQESFCRQSLSGDIVVYFENQQIIVKVQIIHITQKIRPKSLN